MTQKSSLSLKIVVAEIVAAFYFLGCAPEELVEARSQRSETKEAATDDGTPDANAAQGADTWGSWYEPGLLWIQVVNDQGVWRVDEPVAGGIALPRGAVFKPDHLRVRDSWGREIAAQVHQLGMSWPDGSLKHVLVQFQATLSPADTSRATASVAPGAYPQGGYPDAEVGLARVTEYFEIFVSDRVAALPTTPVRVTEDSAKRVVVSTGPMVVDISKLDFRLPNQVHIGAETVVRDGSASIRLDAVRETIDPARLASLRPEERPRLWRFGTDDPDPAVRALAMPGAARAYDDFFRGAVDVKVEEEGPMRAVLRVEKKERSRGVPLGEGDVGFVARIYAYAGKTFLRVELTTINHERLTPVSAASGSTASAPQFVANAKHVTNFRYAIAPELGAAPVAEFGGGAGAVSAGAGASALRQLAIDGYTVAGASALGQAPGWASLSTPSRRVTLAMKNFWETFPKALAYETSPRPALALDFWPAGLSQKNTIAAGRARTYEFVVGFDMNAANVSTLASAELRAMATPWDGAETAAYHFFAPLDAPGFERYKYFTLNSFAQYNLGNMLYGDVDFGDQFGSSDMAVYGPARRPAQMFNRFVTDSTRRYLQLPTNSRYNNYHSAARTPFATCMASGVPSHCRTGEAAVRHTMDIDTVNWHLPGVETVFMTGIRETRNGRAHDHLGLINGGNIVLWYGEFLDHYFLSGNRRVVDLLSAIPRWPSLASAGADPCRRGWVEEALTTNGCPLTYADGTCRPHESYATSRDMALCRTWNPNDEIGGRPDAIPFLQMLHVYEVIGREDAIAREYPGAYPSFAGWARKDAMADASSGLVFFQTIRRAMQYHAWIFNPPLDASGRREPIRYRKSAWMASWPVEAFFRYDRLVDQRESRAQQGFRNANAFHASLALGTGTQVYNASRCELMEPYAAWQPEYREVSGPPGFAFLFSGSERELDRGRAALNWNIDLKRIGVNIGGDDADLPVYAHGLWRTWRGESDVRHVSAAQVAALPSVEAELERHRSGCGVADGAFATYDPAPRVASGCTRTSGVEANPDVARGSHRKAFCLLALDIARVKANTGDVAGARTFLEHGAGRAAFDEACNNERIGFAMYLGTPLSCSP